MIGYLDLKDVLHEVFKDNNCICEDSILNLKGRKIGISFYEIINDLILDVVKQNNWEKGLKEIKKKFDFHGIETLFVIPGLNVFMGKEMQDAFWRIKHEWWKMELFKNLYESTKSSHTNKFEVALQEIAEIYFLDAVTGYYAIHHFRGFLVKTFREHMKDSIVAPQLVGNQILWLYNNDVIDAIMGNPTYFCYNSTDQIICNIDYENKKFYYYDLEKFAVKMNLTVPQARYCILGAYLKFMVDKNLNSKSKFLQASRDKVLEFKKNYKLEFENRKKIIYELFDKLRPVITGSETSMQITKIISTELALNKIDTGNFYNMIMKSPVLTSNGDFIIYPEKRSLSKVNILDITSKELVCFYSLGYIDDELFYLVNKCTNNTFSIKAPRADSVESDYVIMNFLAPHIQRSLYKVCLIANKTLEQMVETKFNMRLQNGDLVPLEVEPEDIRLMTLYTAKTHNNISFFNCLSEFCSVLVKKEHPHEIGKDLPLSENELLFHVYLSLLDELKYINLKDNKVLVLGASFVRCGHSKFEEETLLFFELLKLGLIKGKKFHPSNIENINRLTIQDLSICNSPNSDPQETGKDYEYDSQTQIQKDFYQALKIFEEFNTLQRALTLYQIESNIDKVLETMKCIKTALRKEKLSNYQIMCKTLDEEVSKHIHIITLLSKIFTMGNFNYVNPEKFTDYETHQFDQCLKMVSQTLYRKLSVDLTYAFLNTSSFCDMSILEKAFRRLPFNYLGSPEVSAVIKVVLTKYVAYKALSKFKFSYKLTLAAQIRRSNVEDSLDNKLNISAVLIDRVEFLNYLLKACSYKRDSFEEIIHSLTEAKSFIEEYIDNT